MLSLSDCVSLSHFLILTPSSIILSSGVMCVPVMEIRIIDEAVRIRKFLSGRLLCPTQGFGCFFWGFFIWPWSRLQDRPLCQQCSVVIEVAGQHYNMAGRLPHSFIYKLSVEIIFLLRSSLYKIWDGVRLPDWSPLGPGSGSASPAMPSYLGKIKLDLKS